MASMNKVIEYVDRVKPNVFTDEDKCIWLNTLEGMVAREVMGEDKPPIAIPDDADKELAVPHPYDDIYFLYVSAMIDFHNREYDSYNNTTLMFKERYEQYKAWYIQRHANSKAKNFRNVMG